MGIGTHYTGTAGEMLVKLRLLDRGWNVASMQVDVGDDIMTFRQAGADLSRIQVKTKHAESRRYGYNTQVQVPADQLSSPRQPELYFIFAARFASSWGPLVVVPRADLHDLVVNEEMGSPNGDDYHFWVQYHRSEGSIDSVICEESDLTEYLDDFSHWPRVER